MAPTETSSAHTANGSASKVRSRSSGKRSERKKVEAEVRAKTARDKDVFALQQRLLPEAASETLMVAARGLFQPDDYEAVVEERGLEGLCGYPPCSNAALDDRDKKYSLNAQRCTVEKVCSVANFCSLECRRASASFVVSLAPEPSYVRPESAVVASREAIARQNDIASKDSEAKQTTAADTQEKPAPKIRQKAVVKFSRVSQTYTVQCDEYDGGGAIPGLPSAESKEDSRHLGSSGENKKEWIRRVVSTPITERDDTHTAQPNIASVVGANGKDSLVEAESHSTRPPDEAVITQSVAEKRTLHSQSSIAKSLEVKEAPAVVEEKTEDDTIDDGLFGYFEPLEFPQELLPKSMSVRVWGVLSSWVHDRARDTLWRGIVTACHEQDERPDHMTRHQLLSDTLLQRVPGDLAFIAPRLLQVIGAFQLHDALPPVSDFLLYDLVSALLIRAVLRADVSRKMRHYCQREETIACKLVEDASAQCGMLEDDLRWLEKQLDFLYWS